MEALGAWVRTLVMGAIFCAVALSLVPEGGEKRALRFVCSAVLTLLLLGPLASLEPGKLGALLEGTETLQGEVGELAERAEKESRIALIRRGAEEYIWDAAKNLGIGRLGIRLELDERGALPVPWSISLSGSWTEAQRTRLSLLLEGELGIPPERQNWSMDDAD